MRKYRILELVITRDQTRNALHAPSRSLQESPQEGTAGTEPRKSRLYKLFDTTLVFSRGFLDHAGNIATVQYYISRFCGS